MISIHFKFKYTNNSAMYEAPMLGLQKAIRLNMVALIVILHLANSVDDFKDTTTDEDEYEKALKTVVIGK